MSATAGLDPLAPLAALPGVEGAVARAREAVDGLLRHRVLRRRSAEVTAESSLRGARASAALDGAPIELERLRGQLMAGGVITLDDDRTRGLLTGAVRLHAELGGLLAAFERAPAQALARMHLLAGRDLVTPNRLGRPRGPGEAAEDRLGLGPPPDPAEVNARLDALAALLVDGGTAASAVVVSAVAHGELLVLRPFGTADGLVARATARLVLVARGLDPKSVSAPEVGHVELRPAYADAARGYAGGTPDGVARWVEHCADAVALGAREGLAVCEAVTRG